MKHDISFSDNKSDFKEFLNIDEWERDDYCDPRKLKKVRRKNKYDRLPCELDDE